MYQKNTKKLVNASVLVAIGVVLSTFHFPIGAAKVFPIQHLINVLAGVMLGPGYAVAVAFTISLIRNILGMGSLLAFPGSMIGAFIAGWAYEKWGNHRIAALGEVVGTGLIGGTIAAPFAGLFMGKTVGLFFFVVPFLMSTFAGSIAAFIMLEISSLLKVVQNRRGELK